jgi:predicted AAA+ superfamily ATPase
LAFLFNGHTALLPFLFNGNTSLLPCIITGGVDMERDIFKHLRDWSADPKRKVLLLRGARQVGKTFAARVLGQDFAKYKQRSPIQRLGEVIESVAFQSGSKFKYSERKLNSSIE